jgi:ABC-type nickel/cobalt efflux system permease component RcnA
MPSTSSIGGINKKIALVIAVMALFLAFSEVLGKSAQTEAVNLNIQASDLWNFFQAKNIRRTVVLTAAEAEKAEETAGAEVQAREPIVQQIAQWEKTAARYRSEPETGEGTVELSERAKHAEHERDTRLAQYHNYELASAAFQVGIVLCSAAIITGMMILAWLAGGVAMIGIGLMGLGLFAPHLLHFG